MNFGDPLLQQRNYSLPELEKEQEKSARQELDLKKLILLYN